LLDLIFVRLHLRVDGHHRLILDVNSAWPGFGCSRQLKATAEAGNH